LRDCRCISDEKFQREIEIDSFLQSLVNDTKNYVFNEGVLFDQLFCCLFVCLFLFYFRFSSFLHLLIQ
jgi:hypothetical protein